MKRIESISPAMAISTLDIVRKFLVSQNIDKTAEKIDSIDKMVMYCAIQKKQQSFLNFWVIKK